MIKDCEYIDFVKNETDPCICYYCENTQCAYTKCKQCETKIDIIKNHCSSCRNFIKPYGNK